MKKYAIPKFNIKDNEDEFYLIEDHSGECQLENIPKKEEIKKNTKKFYKLTNLKNDLTNYLNSNPLTKFKAFKKYAEAELIKLNLNVMSNENFYKNIFYPWKKNNIMFKWYSIFNSNKTKLNDIY